PTWAQPPPPAERPGSDRPATRHPGPAPVWGAGRPGAVRPSLRADVRRPAGPLRDPVGVRTRGVRPAMGRRRVATGGVPSRLLVARPPVLRRTDHRRPAVGDEKERQGPPAAGAVPGGGRGGGLPTGLPRPAAAARPRYGAVQRRLSCNRGRGRIPRRRPPPFPAQRSPPGPGGQAG